MNEWNYLLTAGHQRLRHDDVTRQLCRPQINVLKTERTVQAALNTVPDVPEWYLLSTLKYIR